MVLSFVLTPAALASTWYVNGVSGSDSNNCDAPTTPCKTIGRAISLAASGETVRVAAATYTENLTITINVTVIGAGASTTIIDGGASNTVVLISSTAHVTVSNLTIRNGKSGGAGGIYNTGTLTLTSSTVSGNRAAHIVPCSSRVCMALGGGIDNVGKLIISNSIISGNHADLLCNTGVNVCVAWGGGIYNQGTLLIQDSTLTGNSSSCSGSRCGAGGGAVFQGFGGSVTLNNSTVTGSTADHCYGGACSGMGGAIVATNLAMNNSTVSGNPAGGIFTSGTATLQNSIVANNSGKDCSGPITSHGYNLSSDGSCDFGNSGDLNNTNPVLGTLGNN